MIEILKSQAFHYSIYSLCLLGMLFIIVNIISKTFFGTRESRMVFLKNYKKGPFSLIYLISIPLFFSGKLQLAEAIESGTDVLFCFFGSISDAIDLVKLDFGMGSVLEAMQADKFYFITMMICSAVTVVNVIMFSASLIWQRFKNFCIKLSARFYKNLYIVVSCNDKNIMLLNSLKNSKKKARGIMLVKPDAALRDKLYLNGICYDSLDIVNVGMDDVYRKIKSYLKGRLFSGYFHKNVTVIINTDDDERNLLYVKALNNLLHDKKRIANDDKKRIANNKKKRIANNEKEPVVNYEKLVNVPVNANSALVMAYVFCKVEDQHAFNEYVKKSRGHIRLLNRHEQIAFDFVSKYPLTRYMTSQHIDYAKGLIKNDAEINVCLVGFGATNRQIFLKTISDAQFFTEIDGKLVHKKVHYYVFDKDNTYEDKNLNQTYFRYSREFYKDYLEYKKTALEAGITEGSDGWGYLPLPDYPADDWFNPQFNADVSKDCSHFKAHFNKTNINSYDFYEGLKKVFCKENSYTYIIVAFGEDLENIDLAKKISARLETWGKTKDVHIFAKTRSDELLNETYDNITTFGSTKSVYDINKIADNPIQNMAYLKSFKYVRLDNTKVEDRCKKAVLTWMDYSQEQKISNFYCCLSLRTKLNLLGLDYVEVEKADKDCLQLFYEKYYGTTNVDKMDTKNAAMMFASVNVRNYMAIQEHQRWNANYICSGVIPSSKTEIRSESRGKDMEKRLIHGNLTTFEGLAEYFEITNSDVREYDYEIMDYADKLLADAGYKIVRKKFL